MSSSEEANLRIADLESQLAAAQAKLAAPATSAAGDTDPTSWSALSWRGWKVLLALWKSGWRARVLITLVGFTGILILLLVYLPLARFLPQSKLLTPATLGVSTQELGISAIWTGSFTDVENQRLVAQIRQAKSIKFLSYNSDQFIQNFSPEFEDFFNRKDTSMQVLLADPKDPFYIENTKFVLQRDLSPDEIASYQKHLEDAISRLKTLERSKGHQVEVRLFANQMRAPLLIIDDKVCILTVRLPPFESKQSLRIEFDNAPQGFNSKCITHFNQLWAISRTSSRALTRP